MIDSLLWMAESESKYDLLKKEDYKEYFVAAQREFEGNLSEILLLEPAEEGADEPWKQLYREYVTQLPASSEGPDPGNLQRLSGSRRRSLMTGSRAYP